MATGYDESAAGVIRGANAPRIGSSSGTGRELVGMLRPIRALRTDDLEVSAAEPEKVNDTVDGTNRILVLAGSLRRDSYNRALARAAAQFAPSGVAIETFDGLGALPFYDGDLEDRGLPATVVALRWAIMEADALLLATPEYNGATSGVLKNALDWASRGPDRILAGKPVAVMGASTGASGAKGGIESVVRIMGRVRSDVLDHVVAVPFAARAFDDDLALVDSGVRAEVAELISELADRARGNIARAA